MSAVDHQLQTLLQIGEQQRAALLRDDLPAFIYLLDRRSDVLDALVLPVLASGAEWSGLAGLVTDVQTQDAQLAVLLNERLQGTAQELAALHQGYAAARHYLDQPGAPRATYEFRG